MTSRGKNIFLRIWIYRLFQKSIPVMRMSKQTCRKLRQKQFKSWPCPTAYYQSRAAAKLDFHFLLTLAAAWTNKANIVAADNIGILCKKNVGDSGILLCPFSSLRLYISFCFAESEIAFLSRLQIAILVSWVEFHVFWKCCWFRSNLNLTRYQKLGQKWTQKKKSSIYPQDAL